eukprot:7683-Prymnesium_polylepis.1
MMRGRSVRLKQRADRTRLQHERVIRVEAAAVFGPFDRATVVHLLQRRHQLALLECETVERRLLEFGQRLELSRCQCQRGVSERAEECLKEVSTPTGGAITHGRSKPSPRPCRLGEEESGGCHVTPVQQRASAECSAQEEIALVLLGGRVVIEVVRGNRIAHVDAVGAADSLPREALARMHSCMQHRHGHCVPHPRRAQRRARREL